MQDILRKTSKVRRGIDMRLYTVSGKASDKDQQTILSLLSSKHNPDPQYQKEKNELDLLLSESLDKVLLSDRVRSCTDFYKVNNKNSSNALTVG